MAERKNYEMNEQELEGIAGGNGANDDYLYDLGNFMIRHVHGVIHYDDTACLTMRRSPGGEVIPGYGWQNGDEIRRRQLCMVIGNCLRRVSPGFQKLHFNNYIQ